MRQSIGGTWTLQLMILFILIFVGYIILTLDYSRTVKVKNETISIIEKYNGLNNNSIAALNKFLSTSGEYTLGVCENEEGVYGSKSLESNLNSNTLEKGDGTKEYYYCIRKYPGTGKTNYYQITLFYHFNLPILGNFSTFKVIGSSSNFESSDLRDYSCSVGGICN